MDEAYTSYGPEADIYSFCQVVRAVVTGDLWEPPKLPDCLRVDWLLTVEAATCDANPLLRWAADNLHAYICDVVALEEHGGETSAPASSSSSGGSSQYIVIYTHICTHTHQNKQLHCEPS